MKDSMKKTFILIAAMAAAAALASCTGSKACYCYYYTTNGATGNVVYTTVGQNCNTLSTGDGQIGTRVCVEYDEAIDPGQVADK